MAITSNRKSSREARETNNTRESPQKILAARTARGKAKSDSNVLSFPSVKQYLNKVHHGDAVEVMKGLPSGSIDLVVTSPPYNLRNSTGNGLKDGRGGKWERAELINGYQNHSDNLPYPQYVEWQRECLTEMCRLIKDDGAIFYNHKWRVQGGLLQDRHDIIDGFPVRQIIIWRRNGGINFNPGYFLPTYEVIYLICNPGFKLAPKKNSFSDVWTIPQEQDNPHPAPFPVDLAKRCIESTNANIVLDPFMGSGSTGVAAKELGRKWIGIDISEEYCKAATNRIATTKTPTKK